MRQATLKPAREHPSPASEEFEHGGQKQAAYDEGIEEDGAGEAHAEELQHSLIAENEGQKDADHDRRRSGDHATGGGEAVDDRARRVASSNPLFVNPRNEEDLIVHREPE